jgi:plastocyanin
MRLLTALAAILLVVLTVSACGDDDDAADTPDDGGSDATATQDTNGGDDGGSDVTFVEIDAADFSFNPADVSVAADTELTFVLANTGGVPHTLTVYSDAEFTEGVAGADTGNVQDGAVGEFVTTLGAGEYFFRCEVHPTQMAGTITAS